MGHVTDGRENNLYLGIECVKAEDKTPKVKRIGNYYHTRKSSNGRYIDLVSIERLNRRINNKNKGGIIL